MSIPFGLPGPGGSLGMCGICGKPFIAEILLGRSVKTMDGIGLSKPICVHNECVPKDGKIDLETLPDASPLKIAWKNGGTARFTM